MAGEPATGLSERARSEIDASIADSALRMERWISVGRILFFSVLLLRFAWLELWSLGDLLTEVPLVIGIGFSAYVLSRVKTPPRGPLFWLASVTLDAVAAQTSLSQNVLSPRGGYPGILELPDTAGILIAIVAAGLRLSPGAAVWAGLLNLIGLLVLVQIDRAAGPRFATSGLHLSVYLIFIGAATLLSATFAAGTRRIVRRAANAGLRAQQAERGLGTLLADCHDARSLLTSAHLQAEAIRRATHDAGSMRLATASEHLLQDINAVRGLILEINERALADLSSVEPPCPVEVEPQIGSVVRRMRARFPDVKLDIGEIPPNLAVEVTGGEAALQRVLFNIICNACEGDGECLPRTVLVEAEVMEGDGRVELRVIDDGPGWAQPAPGTSTKSEGMGVGLRVVRGIAEASGGRVVVRPRAEGGTIVCIQLSRVGGDEEDG